MNKTIYIIDYVKRKGETVHLGDRRSFNLFDSLKVASFKCDSLNRMMKKGTTIKEDIYAVYEIPGDIALTLDKKVEYSEEGERHHG